MYRYASDQERTLACLIARMHDVERASLRAGAHVRSFISCMHASCIKVFYRIHSRMQRAADGASIGQSQSHVMQRPCSGADARGHPGLIAHCREVSHMYSLPSYASIRMHTILVHKAATPIIASETIRSGMYACSHACMHADLLPLRARRYHPKILANTFDSRTPSCIVSAGNSAIKPGRNFPSAD